MARSNLFWGASATWKTSAALLDATPENPVSYHELEAGGFRRATSRLDIPEGAIYLHQYKRPFDGLEQIGQVIKTDKGNVMPQLRYELDGWVDMFSEFANNYMDDIKQHRRPVIDTATRAWLMVRQYYFELVQKATNGRDADNLGQMKFTTPNDIMLQLLEYAPAYDIDSVWIAHMNDYNPEDIKPDTMKEVLPNVDVSLRFRLVSNKGVATFTKGGEVGSLVGLDVPEPTLSKVNAILDLVATLEREGETYERDAEYLLNVAKIRGLYNG